MKSVSRYRLTSAAAFTGVLLAGAEVRAQGLALDRFDPSYAGDRMFGVASPFVAGHLAVHAGILMDYAHDPLVLRSLSGDRTLGVVVMNQLFLHANATLALWNRLALNVDLPFAVFQNGESPMAAGESFPSPSQAQIGDLRVGARVRLFGDYYDAFQVGLGGAVYVPTGASNAFVGTGSARGSAQLLLGGRTDRVVWSLAAGPRFQSTVVYGGVTEGTQIDAGAGVGFLLDDKRRLQIGPEAFASFVVAKGASAQNDAPRRDVNVEGIVDVRYRVIDPLEIAVGAGPGFTAGVGTPDFTSVLTLTYTPEQKEAPPPDRDDDGIPDVKDACPDVKGVPSADPQKNGCPPPSDRDGDGILDEKDACPDVKGVATDDPKTNGCPLDTDMDGIPDEKDACPTVKGVASDDPKKNGCPADRDGDGIPDAQDACPDVKGVPSDDPKTNGCPLDTDKDGIPDEQDACPEHPGPKNTDPKKNGCPIVRVAETEVFILDQVEFDVDRATIKKVSDSLLEHVASVLKEHLELTKIEVQGHTDATGNRLHNKQLSQARADSVVKALAALGVDRRRLAAKGYGQEKPIADNDTDEGRQKNRRVQFVILEKKSK
jgi:outer membrane protein OmpA-like peptidoglycan-associated protein